VDVPDQPRPRHALHRPRPGCQAAGLALEVGLTERAAQRIVRDLVEAGYLSRRRHGRRNHDTSHLEKSLRHRLEAHRMIGDVIALLDTAADSADAGARLVRQNPTGTGPAGSLIGNAGSRDNR